MVILKEYEYKFDVVYAECMNKELEFAFEVFCKVLFNQFVIDNKLYITNLFEDMDIISDNIRIIMGHYMEGLLENYDGEIEEGLL